MPRSRAFLAQGLVSRDLDFKIVRNHRFGYDSDWVERKESVLHINDSGKALIVAIQGPPSIRRGANVRTVCGFQTKSYG